MNRAILFALIACTLIAAGGQLALGETWDGLGANNDFSTANNWTPVGAPANNGTADLIFDGSTRLSPNVNAPWSVNSISISPTAGGFTIEGSTPTLCGRGPTGNHTPALHRPSSRTTRSRH